MNNLNRAQRRAAKYRKPSYEREVPLPSLIDEFTIFDIPERILKEIANDAVSTMDDVPHFQDNTGTWRETAPCLGGWISTWAHIAKQLDKPLELGAMRAIRDALDKGETIPEETAFKARQELEACRVMFRTNPRKEIQSIAKSAQVGIMLGTM
jgi:hypothetical protein